LSAKDLTKDLTKDLVKDLAKDLAKDPTKDLTGAHRRVGFVHIPAALARKGGDDRGRLGGCPLTWEQALAGALEVLATCLRRTQPGLDPSQAVLLSRRARPRPWARSAFVGKPSR